MSQTINFLSHQRKRVAQVQIQDKKVLRLGIILGSICALISLSIWGVKTYFDVQLSTTSGQVETARSQISLSKDAEESLSVFVLKLRKLVQLESDKKNKTTKISLVQNIFGSVADIDEMTLLPAQSQMKFGLKMKNVAAVDEVLRLANTPETKSQLTSVTLSSLVRDKEGGYSVLVVVPL